MTQALRLHVVTHLMSVALRAEICVRAELGGFLRVLSKRIFEGMGQRF